MNNAPLGRSVVDSEFGGDLKLTTNPTGRPRYGFGIFTGSNDLVAYRTTKPLLRKEKEVDATSESPLPASVRRDDKQPKPASSL